MELRNPRSHKCRYMDVHLMELIYIYMELENMKWKMNIVILYKLKYNYYVGIAFFIYLDNYFHMGRYEYTYLCKNIQGKTGQVRHTF